MDVAKGGLIVKDDLIESIITIAEGIVGTGAGSSLRLLVL